MSVVSIRRDPQPSRLAEHLASEGRGESCRAPRRRAVNLDTAELDIGWQLERVRRELLHRATRTEALAVASPRSPRPATNNQQPGWVGIHPEPARYQRPNMMMISPVLALPISPMTRSPPPNVKPATVPVAAAGREIPTLWSITVIPSPGEPYL